MTKWTILGLTLAILAGCGGVGDDPASLLTAIISADANDRADAESGLRRLIRDGRQEEVEAQLREIVENEDHSDAARAAVMRVLDMCLGGEIVAGLRALLVSDALDNEGRYPLKAPFRRVRLRLRLTNLGDDPVQVWRSSYPLYLFHQLRVVRIEEDGRKLTTIRPHGDLYPNDDLMPPDKEYVTIPPGGWIERDLAMLVIEGYGLDSISLNTHGRFEELRRAGYGEMLHPATYELVAVYQQISRNQDGSIFSFEGDSGPADDIDIWPGPEVRAQRLTVIVSD